MVLLTTTSEVDFSVCTGEEGCGQRIPERVRLMGIIYLEMIKSALNSVSVAEVMKNLIISAIVSTGSFHMGSGSFSDKNIWAPARLQPLD